MMTANDSHAEYDLEILWAKFNARLRVFVQSRVSDPATVEDILQEVFIRVHRHLCCQPDWNKPDGWFYQIARNLIIDYYRRRRELVELSDSLPAAPDLPEEDPAAELALSLKEMIGALPEPYRQALLLTEYQGLTQKQLAESQGISLSGAKSRVQRAPRKTARYAAAVLPLRIRPPRRDCGLLRTLLLLSPRE